jgi:hypothetical protein
MTEIILLIDDGEVDEAFLQVIRGKISQKRKALRKRTREGMYVST